MRNYRIHRVRKSNFFISNWLKQKHFESQRLIKTQIKTQFRDKAQIIGMCTSLLVGLRCPSVNPFSWTKWFRKKKPKELSLEAKNVLQFREKQIGKRIVNMSFNIWSRIDEINRRDDTKKLTQVLMQSISSLIQQLSGFFYILNCGPPAFSRNEAGQKCFSAPGRACFSIFCSGVVKEGKGKGKEEVVANSAGENCCSAPQSCLTLCNPMDCSRSGFPVLHYLLEFVQTHGQ